MKRFFQIFFGILLVIAGIVMLFTPGQGILAIVAGIMLISPYHGRRVVWRICCAWKSFKRWRYSFHFKRTIKRSVLLKRARVLSKKLQQKFKSQILK